MRLGALIKRIRFLVENSYVTFGGEVFKQEIGIAMGLIPAGAIASLVCYTCGKRRGKTLARRLLD